MSDLILKGENFMKFECTICGQYYTAYYSGQFPVCKNCQQKIYFQDMEYWWCEYHDKAHLVYQGTSCYCETHGAFRVQNILQQREFFGDYEYRPNIDVYLVLLEEKVLCRNLSWEMDIDNSPCYFRSEESAINVSKLIQDSRVKKTMVKDNVRLMEFPILLCTNCNNLVAEDYSDRLYCKYCKSLLYKCVVCSNLSTCKYFCSERCEQINRDIYYQEHIAYIKKSKHPTSYVFHVKFRDNEYIQNLNSTTRVEVRKGLKVSKDYVNLANEYIKQEKLNLELQPYKPPSSFNYDISFDSDYVVFEKCGYCNYIHTSREKCPKCSSITRKCLDCDELLIFHSKHIQWYKNKNFTLPVRCNTCREKHKEMLKELNNLKKNILSHNYVYMKNISRYKQEVKWCRSLEELTYTTLYQRYEQDKFEERIKTLKTETK